MSEIIPGNSSRRFHFFKSKFFFFVFGAAVGAGLTLLIPFLWDMRIEALNQGCVHRMKHIGLALHSYHDQYQTFPPAYIVDDEGKPLHSWRTLILPYLGENELYQQIKLDEPWDSGHNKQFHKKMPNIFCCPADPQKQKSGETSYVWLVGKGYLSDGTSCTKLTKISDGTSNTLMVLETLDPICWMAPHDLIFAKIFESKSKGVSSNHPVTNVGFADASVMPFPHPDMYTLRRLATIAGGENLVGP